MPAPTVNDLKKYDLPSTPRPEYLAVADDLQLIRDELGGTRRMHRAYKRYIPKYRSEAPDRYKIRAQGAIFYGGIGRSLSASVGMLFAKPPQKQDTWPAEVTAHWENIDGKGTHGDVFAKRKTRDAIADGFVAILVDYPIPPTDVVVHAGNEAELGLRPLWVSYPRADILSWRTELVEGEEAVTQVVLREGTAANVGRFGVEPVVRYRICRLTLDAGANAWVAWWELLEERQVVAGGEVTVVRVGAGQFLDNAGAPFDEIPLAVCYTGPTDAAFTADPPLLDLAWANLEYWRIASELRWYEQLSAHPQPTVTGELAGNGQISADNQVIRPTLQLGPTTLVQLAEGGKFEWTETKGTAFNGLRASLDAKKNEMAELGASFLRKLARGVETAEAKRLDATAENSTLATAAQGIEDGFNEALRYHAAYLGVPEGQAPTIRINRDYEAATMDAPTMLAYVQLVAAGYPKMLVLEALQAGQRIPEDEDLEALAAEWEAGVQAEADAKALEAAAKFASAQASPASSAA